MAVYISYNDKIPEQITSADLADRITNSVLSPGYQYTFTKSHVGTGGEWKITVTALSSNTIDPNATADFYFGGNYVFTASILYDALANSIYKVDEGYLDNSISGSLNIDYFKWGNINWVKNKVDANSNVGALFVSTVIGSFSFNNIFNSTITDDLSHDEVIEQFNHNTIINSTVYFEGTSSGYFNQNNIRNSQVNFFLKFNYTSEYNEIVNSIININDTTTLPSNIAYRNIIHNSNFDTDNGTVLSNCTIDGISGGVMDTGVTYDGNSYMKNEYSNFWAVYDFSDGGIYNNPTETFTVPSQHTGWVGKFIVQSNVTGDAIGTIVNPPTNHKFFICQESGVDLTINPTLINIATPGALPITLNLSQLDFVELDGRTWTYGPGPALVAVVSYGVY